MARGDVALRVQGLDETVRAFKHLRGETPKGLAKAMRKIADHVVGVAQQRMPFVSGVAEKSLKPKGTQKGASITFPRGGPDSGHDKDGYYPWLDFGGGKAGARGITASSPIAHAKYTGGFKRPVYSKGRYLYPAIAESGPYISDAVDDIMEHLIKGDGFDTTGHV